MSSNTLVLIACLAVAAVLVLGLANMMRGGSVTVAGGATVSSSTVDDWSR